LYNLFYEVNLFLERKLPNKKDNITPNISGKAIINQSQNFIVNKQENNAKKNMIVIKMTIFFVIIYVLYF